MDTHMATMDITMARGLLMLTPVLMLMLSMVTMDTTMARDLLMLRLMPMLTMDTTHMLMDTTDMDTMLMDMPTMVTTDIINLLIFVKEGGVCYVKWVAPSHNCY